MPAANARALEKAKTIPADALIFDLEDAVAGHEVDLDRAVSLSLDRAHLPLVHLAPRRRDGGALAPTGIVHDLDLKDARFGAPEGATVGTVIEGLQLVYADDEALLAQGMSLFEALYRAFEQSSRSTGPRPVARPRKGLTSNRGKSVQQRRGQ